eukprot:2523247-Ditylum_brightwellii.AAC.1
MDLRVLGGVWERRGRVRRRKRARFVESDKRGLGFMLLVDVVVDCVVLGNNSMTDSGSEGVKVED